MEITFVSYLSLCVCSCTYLPGSIPRRARSAQSGPQLCWQLGQFGLHHWGSVFFGPRLHSGTFWASPNWAQNGPHLGTVWSNSLVFTSLRSKLTPCRTGAYRYPYSECVCHSKLLCLRNTGLARFNTTHLPPPNSFSRGAPLSL